MRRLITLLFTALLFITQKTSAQVDEDQLGAWYMYFWNTIINEGPWGFQGDFQYRAWDIGGDMEQLLLRGGLTYQPENTPVKFTLGYAHIETGEFGDGSQTVPENRFYQEALINQKIAKRFYLIHRFRYEQRFVENQDFRTRWRYNLFLNVPINSETLSQGAVYLALYNELFVNGERELGNGEEVELFDRNRTYGAMGYCLNDNLRTQLGVMRQSTNNWIKRQVQISLHHTF